MQDSDNAKEDLLFNAIGRRITVYGEQSEDAKINVVRRFLFEIIPMTVKKNGDDLLPDREGLLDLIVEKGLLIAVYSVSKDFLEAFDWRDKSIPTPAELKSGITALVETHSLFVPALLGNLHGE